MKKRNLISLNLGGGAARGFAHIGAIKALQEHKIPFDIIIGISAGAIAGSLYAFYKDTDLMYNILSNFFESEDFQNSLMGKFVREVHEKPTNMLNKFKQLYIKTGLIKDFMIRGSFTEEGEFENLMKQIIPNRKFSDLKIPFYCVATSLTQGESVIFKDGDLRDATIASASLPLIASPKQINNNYYLDGGLLDKLGIQAAKKIGVDKTIVVDVSNPELNEYKVSHGLDLMVRLNEITTFQHYLRSREKATVVIKPILNTIHWADYFAYKEIIDIGYLETVKKIEEIREKLKISSLLKKYFFIK